MLGNVLKPAKSVVVYKTYFTRKLSCEKKYKVAVVGGAGGIGQPLSLLLKQNPLIDHLAIYDISPVTPGVAVDLSHINTRCQVTGHTGPEQMPCALHGAQVVIIPAGMPRKPGMSRADLFKTNATIIRDIVGCVATACPKAIVAIITNPVNSVVPVACEVLKKAGAFDPNRIMGVTTLDMVRAASFIGEINQIDPLCVRIPVIGGHSGNTIVPLLSQCQPVLQLTDQKKIAELTKRIQEAGTEVVKAKAGSGSATLAMAFAAARFCHSILRALHNEKNVVECAYVQSSMSEAKYFSSPVVLGLHGIEKVLDYGTVSEYEEKLLMKVMPEIIKDIKTGEDFVLGDSKGSGGSGLPKKSIREV